MLKNFRLALVVFIALGLRTFTANSLPPCPVQQSPYQTHVPLPPRSEGNLKTSGGSLFYRYFHSQPGPLVILVPGIPSALYFSDLIRRLTGAGFKVLSFDYPGKMNSSLNGKSDLRFLTRQIEELFQYLHLREEKEWHVIGTSMGGVVAADLTLRNSQLVKSLILLNPVGMNRNWSVRQKLALVPILNKIVAPFVIQNEIRRDIRGALICPENYNNLLHEQDQYLATLRSRWNYLNLVSNFGMRFHSEIYRSLSNLKIPLLIVGGQTGLDPLADQIVQLKSILPEALYRTIPGTSHIPFVERPDETFQLIQTFYGDL